MTFSCNILPLLLFFSLKQFLFFALSNFYHVTLMCSRKWLEKYSGERITYNDSNYFQIKLKQTFFCWAFTDNRFPFYSLVNRKLQRRWGDGNGRVEGGNFGQTLSSLFFAPQILCFRIWLWLELLCRFLSRKLLELQDETFMFNSIFELETNTSCA